MYVSKTVAIFSAALATLITGATAAPTRTSELKVRDSHDQPSYEEHWTPTVTGERRTTHTVVVGRAGLNFDPENVVAEVGAIVEFHFLPRNHSVVQSSFINPCQPLNDYDSFFSGFIPVESGQSDQVYQIEVVDKNPIWYYCAQRNNAHCQNGMAGVINQNFDGPATLREYKEKARQYGGESIFPPYPRGGFLGPNPNPLSGF